MRIPSTRVATSPMIDWNDAEVPIGLSLTRIRNPSGCCSM
jgi:hypothetical protein